MVTSRVPPITVVTYDLITMAAIRKAALKGNEDRYVGTPAGDRILLRLARDPALRERLVAQGLRLAGEQTTWT